MKTYSRVYFSLHLILAISGRSRTQQKLNTHVKFAIYGIKNFIPGDVFGYEEFLGNLLQYTHNSAARGVGDGFQLEVNDGSHTSSVNVNIDVIAVDRSAPVMIPTSYQRIGIYEGESLCQCQH